MLLDLEATRLKTACLWTVIMASRKEVLQIKEWFHNILEHYLSIVVFKKIVYSRDISLLSSVQGNGSWHGCLRGLE